MSVPGWYGTIQNNRGVVGNMRTASGGVGAGGWGSTATGRYSTT